jgi:signal transduction histidine kinase
VYQLACGLLYNRAMFRRHLTLQLAMVLLAASLVPLAGAGYLTLRLLERSVTEQVTRSHEEIALSAGTLVRNYIQAATIKLKSIAQMVRKDEDPQIQTRRLNTLLDPPDLFLEVSYWKMGGKPEVQAQVQQEVYNSALNSQAFGNRRENLRVNQQVATWSADAPILLSAANGIPFAADRLEKVGLFPALPISVPAPEGAVLTANLDFRPISQILSGLAGADQRLLILSDPGTGILATSKDRFLPVFPRSSYRGVAEEALDASRDLSGMTDYVEVSRPAGHARWSIAVREPRDVAMAPLREARRRALLWLGVAAGAALALAPLLASRVLRPVRALARTAEALGRGNLAARTGIERADEIGQLALAFDRMAASLQELDSLKSEFVAHVSHELRTPLTSAKMALANVQEGLGGPDSLARIREDLDRLIRMVNELLDVARIEAGLVLTKEPTDLGQVVRTAAESLRPLARVELDVRGAGDTLEIDAARLQQIVVNLVDNALKYARTRVQVEVRGREVRVTDDGPGVPPEHRERIFEKFSRIETGPKPPGAGLGLSIARKLAHLQGGTLVCEGNTFVLRLS